MTTPQQYRHIDLTALDFGALLQDVLDVIINPPDVHSGKTKIAGIAADVSSMEALIPALIEDIRYTSEENGASVLACEVSGVRKTDEGIRAWGTVELAEGQESRGAVPKLISVSIQRIHDGHWHVQADFEYKETP